MKKRIKRRVRRRRRNQNTIYLFFIFIFLIVVFIMTKCTYNDKKKLPSLIEQISSFQIPGDILYQLKEITKETGRDYIEVVTIYSLKNKFLVDKNSSISHEELYKFCTEDMNKIKKQYSKKDLQKFYTIYEQALKDISTFPITDKGEYIYADSWGATREYGGARKHLGTDIIDVHNNPGNIPIVSMTDGIVEQMGWNEKGGWRVGVRAPSGAYFYYAHLDSFFPGIKEGMEIKSGQYLGYMGDSGYGEVGTVGNFPVHLHLGILLDLPFIKEEVWINPYYILKFAEYSKITWKSQDENS